ncbi:hypothetical protein BpHYR1_002712 [Brachionus plicatilis]|uniref:Uncharacterized protein n=1 Tax=Brachionus plicatilis TaxID=10195 RepID=A0A3M7QI88_BRAPC|nr:hypothetical protein BpHYR1_002712 [Brachionus plicatilis]
MITTSFLSRKKGYNECWFSLKRARFLIQIIFKIEIFRLILSCPRCIQFISISKYSDYFSVGYGQDKPVQYTDVF